jgi:membrane protein implicated in regulation of membrane protease activity
MSGWAWCSIGLALAFVELLVPSGFYLLLLGVSGVAVGLITLAGAASGLTVQLLLFSVLALVACFGFAGKLQHKLKGRRPMTADAVGRIVKVTEVIAPGAIGKGELWGAPWRVRNVGTGVLEPDSEAVVVEVEELTLCVKRR